MVVYQSRSASRLPLSLYCDVLVALGVWGVVLLAGGPDFRLFLVLFDSGVVFC